MLFEITLVTIGPGAIALNLNPYFPHSLARDLKTVTQTLIISHSNCT